MSNPLLDTTTLPRFDDITPEDVLPALEELIASQRSRLSELLDSIPDPDFDSLVAPLEDMEHELSRGLVSGQPPPGSARFSRVARRL